MMGVLATAVLQSSSTSSSIVVTMVAAGRTSVRLVTFFARLQFSSHFLVNTDLYTQCLSVLKLSQFHEYTRGSKKESLLSVNLLIHNVI